MRHNGFTGVHWLLMGTALAGAFSACRLNYETLSDDTTAGVGVGGKSNGGDSGIGGVEAQGASANAGEGNEPNGGSSSATGGTGDGGAGADPGGSSGSGGTAGAGGSAGSSGSGGTGGSPVGDLIVTTNDDENDAGATALAPGGTGLSLREAITIANATSGSQTITFENGIVVAATDTLPTIADAVTIIGGEVNAVGLSNNTGCLLIAAGPTTIDGLTLYDCPGRPLQITGGNDVHIRNCNVHDSGISVDIAATAGTGTVIGPNNTIRASGNHCLSINNDGTQVVGNRIIDCGSVGVILAGTANTRLIGNLIARANFGVSMATGTTGTVIWHNTIAMSSSSGVNVAQGTMNDVRNNIFALNGNYGLAAETARLTQNTHNLFFSNGSGPCNPCMVGASSLQADPLFADAAGDDFTLQANSPAVNAGTPLGVDQNGAGAGDFNGVAADIGYWESP